MNPINKIVFGLLIFILFLSCEREVSTSPELIETPINGKLYIESEPIGSMIYLDGKISGKKTPDSLLWLKDTTYLITLKRPLYRDTSFYMSAKIDDVISAKINYHDNPKMLGRIKCATSPEGAEIVFQGEPTGLYTPNTITGLIPGNYTVSFIKEGYRSKVYDYLVTSDETIGNNIALEDTTVWVTYNKTNSGMPENDLWAVTVDKNNVVWIGTATSGLVKYENGNFSTIPMSYFGMEDVAIYKMSVDSSNTLWMGTSQGMIEYDGINYHVFTTDNSGLPGDVINHIAAHYDTKVWVSTSHGAGVYDKSDWTVFNRTNSEIPSDVINVVNTNVSGEVWLGFSRGGVAIWNGIRFKPFTNFGWASGPTASALPGNTVNAIAQQSDGLVWVGFFPEDFPGGGAGGLTTYDGIRWSNKYIGQLSLEINDIVVSADDTKYVATPEGLCVFKEWGDKRFYRYENSGLYANLINDIEIDRKGNVWMATSAGITKLKIK